jgi:hypothetical protein
VGLGMPRGTGSVASISNKEAELEKLAEPELEEPAAVSKEQAKHAALAKIKASKRARLQKLERSWPSTRCRSSLLNI